MKKAKKPVDVLVLDTLYHRPVGARRGGSTLTMPGGVRLLSNTAGPENLPDGLVVGAIFVEERACQGRNQQIWLEEMATALLETIPSATSCQPVRPATSVSGPSS